MDWVSWRGLLLVVATNTAPVVAAWLARGRGEWPIDCGLVLGDQRRFLGAHKTWRGLGAAVLVGAATAAVIAVPVTAGAIAGALAIVGDALSSFVKRRLDLRPGAWTPGLDQLPESVLPLLAVWSPLGLNLGSFAGTVAVFGVLDLVASRLVGSSRRRRQPLFRARAERGRER
jgi:CDP-diglyceride synthetase